MNDAALVHRRRLVDAMGLGPLWTMRRTTSEPFDAPIARDSIDRIEARVAEIGAMDLAALEAAVTTCRDCALCASRTHAVPGGGATQPHWLVVGPAPTADDDATGEAMDGRPGRLLDAMLAAVGLSRSESVYVTTSVKCRPPDDRPATALEIARCKPYLDRQIELLTPRLVLAVGATAQMRSQTAMNGVPMIATWHPGDLLERPSLKAETWADLCRARDPM